MPIRINLLAEARAEEDLRQRDPVKRSIYLGALLIAAALVWFSSVLLEYVWAKSTYTSLQMDLQAKSNECVVVRSNLQKTAEARQRLEDLNKLSAARFFQGTLLNALQKIYVPNVQLIRLHLDQSYTLNSSEPDKTQNKRAGAPKRPPTVTEHIILTLDAKDYSPSPGDQVNHFKDRLLQSDYFKSCLESNNAVRLSSLSSPQTSEGDSRPYVLFSLECRYQDKTR